MTKPLEPLGKAAHNAVAGDPLGIVIFGAMGQAIHGVTQTAGEPIAANEWVASDPAIGKVRVVQQYVEWKFRSLMPVEDPEIGEPVWWREEQWIIDKVFPDHQTVELRRSSVNMQRFEVVAVSALLKVPPA